MISNNGKIKPDNGHAMADSIGKDERELPLERLSTLRITNNSCVQKAIFINQFSFCMYQ